MSDKTRNYDAEVLALANLALQPRFIQEDETDLQALPEPEEEIAPLEIEVPHKKDVVLRLIKRMKKE